MDLSNEKYIIELFQEIELKNILLLPESDKVEQVLSQVWDKGKWNNWIDSSSKSAPPPDFYCDEYKIMMDVMRVDDHEFIGEKGKPVNLMRKKESEIKKELRDNGILDRFPSANLFITADTGLPTEQDHNYIFYREHFIRVIEKHKKNIVNYKKNHPNYKVIFFICDESSAYVQVAKKPQNYVLNQRMKVENTHFWFADKYFLQSFLNTEIDYVIWFTPYKLIETDNRKILDFPKVVVIDTKCTPFYQIEYNSEKMVSSEI